MGYLRDNPDAGDTAEGIEDWWILQQELKRAAGIVRGALDDLVASGDLVTQAGSDGRMHFRLHPDRKREFERNSGHRENPGGGGAGG